MACLSPSLWPKEPPSAARMVLKWPKLLEEGWQAQRVRAAHDDCARPGYGFGNAAIDEEKRSSRMGAQTGRARTCRRRSSRCGHQP
eukprot:106361-Alexandrium_andersonii.AAC.1